MSFLEGQPHTAFPDEQVEGDEELKEDQEEGDWDNIGRPEQEEGLEHVK